MVVMIITISHHYTVIMIVVIKVISHVDNQYKYIALLMVIKNTLSLWGFPIHGGTPIFIHFSARDFPMEINHPASAVPPFSLGNLHIQARSVAGVGSPISWQSSDGCLVGGRDRIHKMGIQRDVTLW